MNEKLDLTQLRKVAEAATPGPWDIDGPDLAGPDDTLALHNNDGGAIAYVQPLWDDATHIATFDPPTVLALLSRLEQAEQQVARVRALIPDDAHIRKMFMVHSGDLYRALDGESNE